MRDLDVHRARQILLAQAATTLVLSLAGLMFGPQTGLSALIGGATATGANALFAWWIFGRYRASEPGRLVARFYGGEVLKLGATVTALVAAIVWLEFVSPLALLGVFLIVQVFPPLLASRIAG